MVPEAPRSLLCCAASPGKLMGATVMPARSHLGATVMPAVTPPPAPLFVSSLPLPQGSSSCRCRRGGC